MEVDAQLTKQLAVNADPTDAQFRLLVESVSDYAIYLLDTSGRVMSWNAGAERIKGYSAARTRCSATLQKTDAPVRRDGACARTAPAFGPTW